MAQVVVQAFMTLDGVVQGGGGEDEDREGGFDLGGWSMEYDDGDLVMEWEKHVGALILGRKTYDIWAPFWGTADENDDGFTGELTRTYNRVTKYVASHSVTSGTWKNTEFVGDLVTRVRDLREAGDNGGEIRIWGSTEVVASLAAADLIDEYRLLIHPIVLGKGKRLFAEGFPRSTFSLVESRALESGLILAIYRRSTAA